MANTNRMKLYSSFNTLDTLLERQETIIDTIKNAIERENKINTEVVLEYKDSQVISKDNNTFLLEVILNKTNN